MLRENATSGHVFPFQFPNKHGPTQTRTAAAADEDAHGQHRIHDRRPGRAAHDVAPHRLPLHRHLPRSGFRHQEERRTHPAGQGIAALQGYFATDPFHRGGGRDPQKRHRKHRRRQPSETEPQTQTLLGLRQPHAGRHDRQGPVVGHRSQSGRSDRRKTAGSTASLPFGTRSRRTRPQGRAVRLHHQLRQHLVLRHGRRPLQALQNLAHRRRTAARRRMGTRSGTPRRFHGRLPP